MREFRGEHVTSQHLWANHGETMLGVYTRMMRLRAASEGYVLGEVKHHIPQGAEGTVTITVWAAGTLDQAGADAVRAELGGPDGCPTVTA